MADKGVIYYGITRRNSENILYLAGQSSDIPVSTKETWTQRLSDTENPWNNISGTQAIFKSDSTSGADGVYKVEILSDIIPITCVNLFSQCQAKDMSGNYVHCNFSEITGAEHLDTSYCVKMDYMFMGARLTDNVLNFISALDTRNVTSMEGMFYYSRVDGIPSNVILDLSNFDTSNVTNMSRMFDSCLANEIDVTSFDTSKVTSMQRMFQLAYYISEIDVSSFTIESLTNTTEMFDMYGGVKRLTTIYAHPEADWSSSSILTSSTNMFRDCTALVGGNGTEHSTSTSTAANDKTRARIDKTGQAGYFTVARRTVTKSITGSGTITGDGEYDYGTTVQVTVSPNTGYYTDIVQKTDRSSTEILSDTDVINAQTFSFSLTKNTDISAEFVERQQHALVVSQEGTDYGIQGAGSYLYLDAPILIADLNEAAVSFLGWYNGNELVSTKNPYSFTMPDSDVTYVARFGETPFADEDSPRQFVLRNRDGEIFQLTSKNSSVFLNNPSGLGYSKKLSSVRIGNNERVYDETYDLPAPSGELYFFNDKKDLNDIYSDYNSFVRFSTKKPIVLWYKIPVLADANIDDIFHIPVEITSLEKKEVDQKGALVSQIKFHGTGFWKHTQSELSGSDASITTFNSGDTEVGIEITVNKGDNTAFTNPVLTFSSNDEDYGIFALEGTFTKLYLNTKDGEQKIELWDTNNASVTDPFLYLNFAVADGVKKFPYPKLKNGVYNTITFSYDGIESEAQNILVIYDKEYVSV